MKIVGVPIGTTDYKAQFLSQKFSKLASTIDSLNEFDSLQLKLLLIRYLSFSSINFTCRCTVPVITYQFSRALESKVCEFLFRVCGINSISQSDFNSSEYFWNIMLLPINRGGFGIPLTSWYSNIAFQSSVWHYYHRSNSVIQNLVNNGSGIVSSSMRTVVNELTTLQSNVVSFPSSFRRVQNFLASRVKDYHYQAVLSRLSISQRKCLFESGNSGNDFLRAIPTSKSFSFSNNEFQICLALQLGSPIRGLPFSCYCKNRCTRNHVKVCKFRFHKRTHDSVTKVLIDMCRSASYSVLTSDSPNMQHLESATSKKVVDFKISTDEMNSVPSFIDVTIVNTYDEDNATEFASTDRAEKENKTCLHCRIGSR